MARGSNGRIEENVAAAEEMLGGAVEQARAQLEDVDRQLRRLVEERPLLALAGAVVTGYLVGRLLSRR